MILGYIDVKPQLHYCVRLINDSRVPAKKNNYFRTSINNRSFIFYFRKVKNERSVLDSPEDR